MMNIKFDVEKKMKEHLNKILNEKLNHLKDAIKMEKSGSFTTKSLPNKSFTIIPVGFSKELTEKINQALGHNS